MQFANIPGYTPTKQHLLSLAQQQQVPHAQLFWGPEGNASLPLAWAWATYLLCQQPQSEDACGQCTACKAMHQGTHPDVKFVFPTTPTAKITGKEVVSSSFLKLWRTFLQERPYGQLRDWTHVLHSENKQPSIAREEAREIMHYVSYKAFEGRYKLVLLWLPEYLHPTAANALLKVLEEPPPYTVFLLVSVQPDKVLGTIRSRTQPLHIPALTDEALTHLLQQHYTLEPAQLASILLLADGNLNKAWQLADQTADTYFAHFKDWMRSCYTHHGPQLVGQANAFQEMGKDLQKNLLTYALHMLREALLSSFAQPTLTRTTPVEQKFTQKLKTTLTHAQLTACIQGLNEAYYHLERYANPKILYLDLSLKIAANFTKGAPASPRPAA